ncbi:MAG TPA: hypothetical protein VH092_27285 [Urbifossiella sp.]|jgi:hypothetical protein|nr:hypothetical protein [Urbifossiella sp.]
MIRVVGAVAGVVAIAAGLSAQPDGAPVAATATSPAATFSARAPGSDLFKIVPADADVRVGDLLVTLPGAVARSATGAVTVTSLADYDGRSPLPILETAFTLNEAKDADLDVTLDRGRLDLANTKPAGAAVAKVRFWDQTWTVTLDAPGTRVAVELCARWPAGSRFKAAEPGAPTKAAPVASLVLLVLKGEPTVNVGGLTVGLAAPPGPALIEWDSVEGTHPRPRRLEKLPDWADPDAGLSAGGKKTAAAVEKFRAARAADAAAAFRAFLDSADPVEQRVALVTAGATDDFDLLRKALAEAKTQEEWDFGITVIRHWLGRCPGQDQKLYGLFVGPTRGYTPAQARILMQLLFGFSADDLQQPETYEVLIDYLTDDLPAVRNLAAWHLVRAVPGGRAIGFKPGGTKAECEAAAREWRRRVPPGQLPAPEKK